jgi:hypothetical protein
MGLAFRMASKLLGVKQLVNSQYELEMAVKTSPARASLILDQKKLKTVALVIGILFLATVAIHTYTE